ncbi:MAG TPA: hypothetical protein HA282_05050 [Nanoarchaeota archaeon]|nr:hypothetical protein [Candidatus Pacearchaeota archaeon]HIH18187.1 hypothetical protein [Nanoarchaeota archaeon]HIH34576.1 hypothetical protein [Nanoarchaeota archaeon]HIH51850.1 hypothetical protein [Nanoarchaeota archaeon]HIH66549.1 hypothetical protein [Nanoarchaeota archaeon]
MLSSSLREKRHYLALELLSEASLSQDQARNALQSAVKDFLGSAEAGTAGMQIIELKPLKEKGGKKYGLFVMRGILSINRKKVLKTRAALSLISEIGGKKASCTVLGVSGTLRALREKFLK